jgi:hypothetical protein
VGEEGIVLEDGCHVALIGRERGDLLPVEKMRGVGWSNPAIIRRLVVLPEPDGPSKVKNSPS